MKPAPPSTGEILQEEHPVLRQIAEPVPLSDIGTRKLGDIVAKMKEELAKQPDGVAIAAPQIGAPLRIFVVSGRVFTLGEDDDEEDSEPGRKRRTPGDTPAPADLVFINPEITKLSRKKRWTPEGCLSVRWFYGETFRSEKATVKALDERGKPFVRGASGLLAQIFQHETDHLNGILFVDHARNIEKILPENPARGRKTSGKKPAERKRA